MDRGARARAPGPEQNSRGESAPMLLQQIIKNIALHITDHTMTAWGRVQKISNS